MAAGMMHGANGATTRGAEDAIVYIGWPNNGQVIPAGRPFRVWFGLRNMGVAPKGG